MRASFGVLFFCAKHKENPDRSALAGDIVFTEFIKCFLNYDTSRVGFVKKKKHIVVKSI